MPTYKPLDEASYKADFTISENYIAFSSELLRLSLLALGGFGTLILVQVKEEAHRDILAHPVFFILAMVFFVIAAAASLAHRYCATDTMSWHISWLRAAQNGDEAKAKKERAGLRRLLKYSRLSLIACEAAFALAVVFFLVAVVQLVAGCDG